MQYLMVQNSGEIKLSGVRVLGLSNKTTKQIGQFGTGLKEAVTLMLRHGVAPIIFSGSVRIDFSIQKHEVEEICFKLDSEIGQYGSGVWHGMGISPMWGKYDWTNWYQVLREVFCNAFDESGHLMKHKIVDEPVAELGKTSVYIPLNQECLKEYGLLANKLLFLGNIKKFGITGTVEFLERTDPLGVCIFKKDVLIQRHGSQGLFDYQCADLKLNESRSADWYLVWSEIAHALGAAPVRVVKAYIEAARQEDFPKTFEYQLDSYAIRSNLVSDTWRDAWKQLYGHGIPCPMSSSYIAERLKRLGKMPIPCPQSLITTLKKAGIDTYETALDKHEQSGIEIIKETPEAFHVLWSKIVKRGWHDNKIKPDCFCFKKQMNACEKLFGFVDNGTVYINESILGSKEEELAIVEEIMHYVSGKDDMSRDFQSYLIETIVSAL